MNAEEGLQPVLAELQGSGVELDGWCRDLLARLSPGLWCSFVKNVRRAAPPLRGNVGFLSGLLLDLQAAEGTRPDYSHEQGWYCILCADARLATACLWTHLAYM
jgi:hypothetical protein